MWKFAVAALAVSAATPLLAEDRRVDFDCGGAGAISVTFAKDSAILTGPAGQMFTLAQRPAASGFWYEGAGHTLRGKERDLVWTTRTAKPQRCSERAAPVEPAGDGFTVEGTDLVHGPSGMRFPQTVARFTREVARGFDPDGDYVTVNYVAPAGRDQVKTWISLVHLEGMSALEHYAGLKPQFAARLPGAQTLEEGRFPVKGADGGEGYRGLFSGDGKTIGLITANFGYWSARLRSEYPAAAAKPAQAALRRFVDALDWSALAKHDGTPSRNE